MARRWGAAWFLGQVGGRDPGQGRRGHSHPVHVVVQLLEGTGRQLLLPLGLGGGLLLCGWASCHPPLCPLAPPTPKPALPHTPRSCVPGPMLGPGALSQATVGGSPGQPWDADLNKQGLQRPREGWLGARPQVCHVWEAPTIETQACHQALSLTWRVGNGGWGGSVTRQGG